MKIGAKSGKATTKVKKTTKPETIVAGQIAGLVNLEFRREVVVEQAMFRDLRETIERIGNRTDNEKARSRADQVAKCLGEMAPHLEFLQSFVPSPGDAAPSIVDEALNAIEEAALEHVRELISAIRIACLASVLFGHELAGDPRSLENIKKIQREQAKRAREGRRKKLAVSPKEQAINASIEKGLGQATSGSAHKDAISILDLVNADLAKAGRGKVSVDTIRRRIEKRRAFNRAL